MMVINEIKATLALSILDSMRQRGLSVEAAAQAAGVDPERLRALVERRDLKAFSAEDLMDILDAIDGSGPRYGGKP